MSQTILQNSHCAGCGMLTKTDREYHPITACKLYKALLNSDHVRSNLVVAVEYGMLAARAGVSLADAMADFNLVLDAPKQETT